jgi:hypothetical protein
MKLRQVKPKWHTRQSARPANKNSRVKIEGRHDLEEFSLALQVMISRLQDMNIAAVQNISLYFEPLDCHGLRTTLTDATGKPAEVITIDRPR